MNLRTNATQLKPRPFGGYWRHQETRELFLVADLIISGIRPSCECGRCWFVR
jgi:hypothetical protein